MIREWFDPRKFKLRIESVGNVLHFDAEWPVAFPYLVATVLLLWWLS